MAYGSEYPDEFTNDHSLLRLDYGSYGNSVASLHELDRCRSGTVSALSYASVHLRLHFISGDFGIT
jgi:hypothetical protein